MFISVLRNAGSQATPLFLGELINQGRVEYDKVNLQTRTPKREAAPVDLAHITNLNLSAHTDRNTCQRNLTCTCHNPTTQLQLAPFTLGSRTGQPQKEIPGLLANCTVSTLPVLTLYQPHSCSKSLGKSAPQSVECFPWGKGHQTCSYIVLVLLFHKRLLILVESLLQGQAFIFSPIPFLHLLKALILAYLQSKKGLSQAGTLGIMLDNPLKCWCFFPQNDMDIYEYCVHGTQ